MNPGLTQAQFNAIELRIGFLIGLWRACREFRNRFRRSTVRTIEINDYNGNFSSPPSLTGVNLGTNTDASGLIYWRITVNGGNWDVKGYAATGAASLVTQALNVAANSSASLTAQNSSGLTGTITLAASVTAETDDKHRTNCFPDFPLTAANIFNGSETRDADARPVMDDLLRDEAAFAGQMEARVISALQRLFTVYVGPTAKVTNPNGALLSPAYTVDGNGAVTPSITGSAEDFRANMLANTTVQTVLKAAPSAGSVSYESTNVGLGVLTVYSIYESVKPGLISLVCTDPTIGQEKFTVTCQPTDLSDVIQAANPLTVGQAWGDQKIGIGSMTLARTFSKTGDGTNVDFAAATGGSAPTVSGLTAQNSSGGSFGVKITANGSNWDVKFYKTTSGFQSGDLVAQATGVATGAAFQATQQNKSGLTVNWTVGSAPTDTHTATLNCNTFSSANGTPPLADRISFTITSSSPGAIQQAWGETVRWYLNSAAANPTWVDGVGTRGGSVFSSFAT